MPLGQQRRGRVPALGVEHPGDEHGLAEASTSTVSPSIARITVAGGACEPALFSPRQGLVNCLLCGTPLEIPPYTEGRPRKYCSPAHRQAHYRRLAKAAADE